VLYYPHEQQTRTLRQYKRKEESRNQPSQEQDYHRSEGVAHDESQEGRVFWVNDKFRLLLAHRFIDLVRAENTQLHGVIRLLGQLVDDMENNCSFEVFEAQWVEMTNQVKVLAKFFETHKTSLEELMAEIGA